MKSDSASNNAPKTPYKPNVVSFPINAPKHASQISSKDSTNTTETRSAALTSATEGLSSAILVSSKSGLATTTVADSVGPRRPAIEVEKDPKEEVE